MASSATLSKVASDGSAAGPSRAKRRKLDSTASTAWPSYDEPTISAVLNQFAPRSSPAGLKMAQVVGDVR